jgi:hypothetical protein
VPPERTSLVLVGRRCLQHCAVWLRDLDTKKIGTEIYGELRNVVMQENGEDKNGQ